LFTGKERDSESGLDNFGARFDSSALGRFASPDDGFVGWDQGDPQTLNLYTYARNNPLNMVDDDGHDAKPAGRCGPVCQFCAGEDELEAQRVPGLRAMDYDLDCLALMDNHDGR
jgi:RHS repeat-associated protein